MKSFEELSLTDRKAPIFNKIVENHNGFKELKTLIDAEMQKKYNKHKYLKGEIWTGFANNDQYLSHITKDNKPGNKIAELQYKILLETGFLDKNHQEKFRYWRVWSIDWDKVRSL